jgi:hypothetical protein
MPERHDLQKCVTNPVVDEILHSTKIQPANFIGTNCFYADADTRLVHKQRQRRFNILANCAGSRRPVVGSPCCGVFYFALRAGLDPDDESQDQP